MAALRELLARFSVSFDDKELRKGAKAVDDVAGKLGKLAVAAAGAFAGKKIVDGVTDFVESIAEQADQLGDMAERFGISTDALQEFGFAAKLSGAEAEDLTTGIIRLQSAAGTGSDALSGLGISARDATGQLKSADVLLEDVAERFEKIKSPTERTSKAIQIFGRNGAKLVPLLSRGRKGIADLRKEFRDLGGGFSKETIEQAGKYKDSIDRLNVAWTGFKSKLGAFVIPLAEKFVNVATDASRTVGGWVKALKPLIDQSNILKGAMVALGVAIIAAFGPAALAILPTILALTALAVIVDELVTLFQGGDTIIGRVLDNLFGPGSAKRVADFGNEIFGMFAQAGRSSEDFYRVVDGVWKSIVLAAAIAAEEVRKLWQGVGATIYDAIDEPFRKAHNAGIDKQIEELKANAPSVPNRDEWLQKEIAKLEAQKEKSQTEINDAYSAQRAQEFADRYDRIAKQLDPRLHTPEGKAEADMRATGLIGPPALPATTPAYATVPTPGASTTTVVNDVKVTVPPGTPATMARDVGDQVRRALQPSAKATINAVSKTAG